MGSILKHIDTEEKETILIQGQVESSVVLEARKEMKNLGLTWSDILTACLLAFLEEIKQKKK